MKILNAGKKLKIEYKKIQFSTKKIVRLDKIGKLSSEIIPGHSKIVSSILHGKSNLIITERK